MRAKTRAYLDQRNKALSGGHARSKEPQEKSAKDALLHALQIEKHGTHYNDAKIEGR